MKQPLIQPYNPTWPAHFQQIANVLRTVLSDADMSIEHVGSTSVPGLAAKAIIDIDVVYPVSLSFGHVRDRLESLDYAHRGDYGIPGREVFKRAAGQAEHPVLDSIVHHLYVCRFDNRELHRHLAFRDYLRANPAAREAYATLKLELAAQTNQDKEAYSELKEVAARSFIEGTLRKAGL